MATVGAGAETSAPTDIGVIWKAAIDRYEEITMVKIKSLVEDNKVDDILVNIHERETMFKDYRHDGSKLDKFRSLVGKSLSPIEKLSNVVSSAALAVRQHLCMLIS